MSPDTPGFVDRTCAVTVLLMLVSGGLLNVVAMEAGPGQRTEGPLAQAIGPALGGQEVVTSSRTSRAPLDLPDEALFMDPPKENRILPIYTGNINQSELDSFEDLGVGGMVINNWQWTQADLQHADDMDWTVWVNDYYMYPSGNANMFGGVHETFWNPSFEIDSLGLWPDGWVWTYYDWPKYDRSGTQSHSGSSAIACDDFNFMLWGLGVEEGLEYNFSAWSKGDTGSEWGRILIFWFDVDKHISTNGTIFQTGPGYQRYSVTARAPTGANVVKILLMGHESKKYVWFDDAMVRLEDQLTYNDLLNADLETDNPPDGQPDGWSPMNAPTWDTSGTYSHSPASAVRVNATDIYLQAVPVNPGGGYYVGEWIRSETGLTFGQVVVLWVNATWGLVDLDQRVMAVDDTYDYYDMVVTAPLNASSCIVALASASNSFVYVDDVSFAVFSPLNNGVSRGPVLDGHPELEAQGLYYNSQDVVAPATSDLVVPFGEVVSAVAAPVQGDGSLDLSMAVDVSGDIVNGTVQWTPTSGLWRVMAFTVDILYNGTEVAPAITNMHQINVMNRVAVQRFIEEMYEKTIRDDTTQYLGDMIVASFTDEVSNLAGYFLRGEPYPVVAWLDDDVNDLHLEDYFTTLHGYDLLGVLPALWNDVGARTAKYRVDFYNTTAYLQGEAYYRMIGDWCNDHGINFSGHLLAEDSLIHHVAFYGDFFESIKHMGYPGMDTLLHSAGTLDHDLIVPKMVSSASVLYGKDHTMTEYSVSAGSMNLRNMTAVVNWEAVQGIDIVTSFAFWRGVIPDDDLRAHSAHVGRTNYMLQQGDYTTDIAVLYPITTMQAEYVPSKEVVWNRDLFGGFDHDESFKNLTLSLLTGQLDFVYINDESLHASVLDTSSGTVLRHGVSGLDLRVLVLPEMDVIGTRTMEMVRDFYVAGGTVVAVGDLPTASAENGTDPYIDQLVDEVFDTGPVGASGYTTRSNADGGTSFRGKGDMDPIREPLSDTVGPDLLLSMEDSHIYYMKRTAPGFDTYFLVNNRVTDSIRDYELKTLGDPYAWDPETGAVQAISGNDYHYDPFTGYTTIRSVTVKGFSSVFIVFKKPALELIPDGLSLSPSEPLAGETVTISADINNIGHGIAPQVKVRAWDGGVGTGAQIGTTETISIAALDLETVTFDWDTTDFPHMRTVTVEACLPDGACVSISRDFFVNTPPWVGIDVDVTEVLTFEDISLVTNITDVGYPIQNFSWDLGDGTVSNLTDIIHAYDDDGVYTVTLWVTDANGTVNSSTVDITVLNRMPEAGFEVSPAKEGDATTVFVMNGSASTDMDGVVALFSWDLGDNSTAGGMTVEHSYARPGNYTVTLTVEDDDGGTNMTRLELITTNLAPVANFTVWPGTGDIHTTYLFNSTSLDLDGDVMDLDWSLGDGTHANGTSVEHTYSDDGAYEVTLRVMDDLELWSTVASMEVVVSNLAPVPKAAPGTQTVKVGQLANFSAAGTTDPDDLLSDLRLEWEWGDGSGFGKGVNVSHVYTEVGEYNVTLKVTDDDGASANVTVKVVVEVAKRPKPRPDDGNDMTGLLIALAVVMIVVVAALLLYLERRASMARRSDYHVVPHDGQMHDIPPSGEETTTVPGKVEGEDEVEEGAVGDEAADHGKGPVDHGHTEGSEGEGSKEEKVSE